MQSKQQIQSILAQCGARPDKKLGQNFLFDTNLINFLVSQAQITKSDAVIEVGPGTGSLTEALAEAAGGVVAVEYDKMLGKCVSERFKDYENVKIICADALQTKNQLNPDLIAEAEKLQSSLNGRLILAANLPYNIASSVMINAVTGRPFAGQMYVTIQKEVGRRMTAPCGSKIYGPLSIIIQALGEVEILKTLPPQVFWPPPKVESVMVKFEKNMSKTARIKDIYLLKETVSLFMGHRRKTLRACCRLADGQLSQVENWEDIFRKAEIDSNFRGEKLSPSEYVGLSNILFDLLQTR
ncbi:16S rRNA (adenine(1518)-N(6)/adenine(1519)-N(6))-dimethyltransferase RsmA [Sedimentisphaera salicampi]|uniref:16S rRNA (adenine(1518)-N(6)/adenine(1519)-N(6))- dimethyltransferase RsmA n=1 Tax=Sedimentisphaera salicampi TaxID=1941349 RepID=UPI000B9B02F4|nr:16S rRNA (adenine(1518)-N(6)/adenine(1519)-N(6))-dimethyltransferase RsmA [Sedimentisphaera salicampi]OXU16173.1 Ribosomal RNA small subunit methyltransferase A [Sedimentisphaera salicampi]